MSNKKIFKPLNNYIYMNERNEEKSTNTKTKTKAINLTQEIMKW